MRYLILLLLLSSCGSLYLPATRNTPLFREQGEAQVGVYLTSAGLEAQGAYALADHLAVIGNFSYTNVKDTEHDYTRTNNYGEIGLGYFDRSRSARYEVFVGYGMGQGTNWDAYYFFTPPLDEVVATAKMNRIFLQPSIGTNNRTTNVAFTPRFSWVDFTEFSAPGQTTKMPNEDPVIYIEPALTIKTKLSGNLHGFFQLGIAFPIGEPYYTYQSLQAAIGVQIDTGGLKTRVYGK